MNDRRALFIDNNSKEILFTDDFKNESFHLNHAYWLPCLGYSKKAFDGHIYISGATGSGKTYFIKRMVMNDKKRRKLILFTDLKYKDPSLVDVEYDKFDETGEKNWEWVEQNEKNKILVFDDVQFNEKILEYRDKMLEKGRHMNTIVVCVNHRLQDNWRTRVPLNEARFLVTFPCSNRGNVFRYLKHEFEIDPKKLNYILDRACTEGRYLIIHRFHPVCVASTETIIKL